MRRLVNTLWKTSHWHVIDLSSLIKCTFTDYTTNKPITYEIFMLTACWQCERLDKVLITWKISRTTSNRFSNVVNTNDTRISSVADYCKTFNTLLTVLTEWPNQMQIWSGNSIKIICSKAYSNILKTHKDVHHVWSMTNRMTWPLHNAAT